MTTFTYAMAVAMAVEAGIGWPWHRNDQGAMYFDGPIRPLDGHDPRDTVGQCPTCL